MIYTYWIKVMKVETINLTSLPLWSQTCISIFRARIPITARQSGSEVIRLVVSTFITIYNLQMHMSLRSFWYKFQQQPNQIFWDTQIRLSCYWRHSRENKSLVIDEVSILMLYDLLNSWIQQIGYNLRIIIT